MTWLVGVGVSCFLQPPPEPAQMLLWLNRTLEIHQGALAEDKAEQVRGTTQAPPIAARGLCTHRPKSILSAQSLLSGRRGQSEKLG